MSLDIVFVDTQAHSKSVITLQSGSTSDHMNRPEELKWFREPC